MYIYKFIYILAPVQVNGPPQGMQPHSVAVEKSHATATLTNNKV